MDSMKWNGKWIWDSGEASPENYWLCFRKSFEHFDVIDNAILSITADSRFYLYINGIMLGYGPVRSWPWELSFDKYDIKPFLKTGENIIAVLVNHYGTSTAQYIHGRGGLIAQMDFFKNEEKYNSICSDSTWKVHMHESFNRNTGRINVAFPWIEEYDSRKFDFGWNRCEYIDSSWENALEIGEPGMKPWSRLVERDIAPYSYEKVCPKKVESLKCVKKRGQHVCLDFAHNFYPGCYDTKDKKQLGYIVSIIHSPEEMYGTVKHLSKKWPEVPEKIKLNGNEYIFDIGENTKNILLKKGENLLIVDISGGYQRFELSLLFDFELEIEFRTHYKGNVHKFLTAGPFDFQPVHNIASMEGVVLNDKMPEYLGIWNANSIQELEKFDNWIKPVPDSKISTNNIAILSTEKELLKEYVVRPQLQNMVKSNDEYSLIERFDDGDAEIIIDFGEEISAFTEMDIECEEGVVFDFYMFECMYEGKVEYTDGLNNTFRYISKSGRQRYRSFIKRGFRYTMLTIRNLRKPAKIYSITAYKSGYPAVETGRFQCSDNILNEIWKICQHTVKLCMEDTFVDCPTYEQAFWIGDSRTSSLISNYLFGSYELTKRCLMLAAKSLERSEIPEAEVPTGCDTILTAWSLLWVISCREYYEFTGDKESLNEIYPYLVKTIENFCKYIDDRGLLNINAWNMLDWAGMDTPADGIVTHQNALLVKAIRDTVYILDILSIGGDKEYLNSLTDKIIQAINRHMWNDEKKAYIDCIHSDGNKSEVVSLQTNVMIYLCECATEERKKIIENHLLNTPDSFIKIGSPFMSFFYYEALLKNKNSGVIKYIIGDIRKNWGEMLRYNATTCWETFLGFYKYTLTRSHCHAWSAGPAYFFGAYILGVRPLEPGFEKVLIEPNLGDLKWANGVVPTPKGSIYIDLKVGSEGLIVNIKKPKGIECITSVNKGIRPEITIIETI